MRIRISRREVLKNLIRFKDSLLENEKGQKGKKERRYQAILNCTTGDLRFAQKISSLEHHFPSQGKSKGSLSDWKKVYLIVKEEEEHPFAICDEGEKSLNPKELAPLAWRILSETVKVLNQKVQEASAMPDELLLEEFILRDLSSIYLEAAHSPIEDLPGWEGFLNREKAEEKLTGQPVGSYLLREGDELTLSIAFHLAEEERSYVHPYLLTFVGKEEKISEMLLLHTDKGWTFYCDDPDLEQPFYHYYPSAGELLLTLHAVARIPINHERAS